jgi:hypothetical protein
MESLAAKDCFLENEEGVGVQACQAARLHSVNQSHCGFTSTLTPMILPWCRPEAPRR